MFQEINISNVSIFFNWLSILHIPFDEYNNFRHFHSTIIAELSRARSKFDISNFTFKFYKQITSLSTYYWEFSNIFRLTTILKSKWIAAKIVLKHKVLHYCNFESYSCFNNNKYQLVVLSIAPKYFLRIWLKLSNFSL